MLHVYHHATISFIWWMITYTAPGGDAYFSAALNSFVVRTASGTPCSRLAHHRLLTCLLPRPWQHVLMYTYYLMAILLGKDPKVCSGQPFHATACVSDNSRPAPHSPGSGALPVVGALPDPVPDAAVPSQPGAGASSMWACATAAR